MEASPRDIMYTLDAAHAEAEPQKLAETDLRYSHGPWHDTHRAKGLLGSSGNCC